MAESGKQYVKKSYKKGYKKGKKGFKRYRRNPFITRNVQPNTFATRLTYEDCKTMTVTGAPVQTVFRLNSLYDVDYTGLGHQPSGFDQLAALYDKYCVVSSKVFIEPFCEDNATLYFGFIGAIVMDDDNNYTTVHSTYNSALEGCKQKRLIQCSTDGIMQMKPKLKIGFSAKKLFHLNSTPLEEDSICSAIGTNPSRGAYLCIWVSSNDDSTELPAIRVHVRIEQNAIFFDKKQLTTS